MDKIDTNIWNRHNNAVKEWECNFNITKKKKKFYRKHNKLSNNRTTSNKKENQRTNHNHDNFNQNNSTPYNRRGGFYDNDAHIR